VTRDRLPALGYLYVAFELAALLVGPAHQELQSSLLTAALFAFFWFLVSLRALLVRFDPDAFFAGAVLLGGAAYAALESVAVLRGDVQIAAPAAAGAATAIVGSSLAALRARKIDKWFGNAGVAGGIAVLLVGIAETGADWTVAGRSVFASSLGFMIWVLVTATYLLRR
jgi:hypothetical protein